MENFTIFLICLALISAVFGGMIVILVVQNTAAKKDVPDKGIGKIFLLASLVGAIFFILYGSVHFGGGNNPVFSKKDSNGNIVGKEIKRTFWALENGVFFDAYKAEEHRQALEEIYNFPMGIISLEEKGTYNVVFHIDEPFTSSQEVLDFQTNKRFAGKAVEFYDVWMPVEQEEQSSVLSFWKEI